MTDKKTVTLTIEPPRNPTTPDEWQNAVDAAKALSVLHAARSYGLVKGGPKVDVDRCDELLEQGLRLGVTPRPDAVERFVEGWNLPDKEHER
ncbi:hypothetical protein [Paludisphaera rhizosphaerae]|uniref:hypothetical protein n=1 Tax=Paludisphaera rhizosphaerae TaxID=2711216 RepID=UPI0013ED9C42|nr:hypothetical protein [Paludisphaera rhizosphaerae]